MSDFNTAISQAKKELYDGFDDHWWCRSAAKSLLASKHRIIADREVSTLPYLIRFYLHSRWKTLGLFRAVIHRFCRSDNIDDGLHSHPWPYITYVLSGGYYEHLPGDKVVWRKQGDIVFASSKRLHRIELATDWEGNDIPCWTLFIMGPRMNKDWGFIVDGVTYPHKKWFEIRRRA